VTLRVKEKGKEEAILFLDYLEEFQILSSLIEFLDFQSTEQMHSDLKICVLKMLFRFDEKYEALFKNIPMIKFLLCLFETNDNLRELVTTIHIIITGSLLCRDGESCFSIANIKETDSGVRYHPIHCINPFIHISSLTISILPLMIPSSLLLSSSYQTKDLQISADSKTVKKWLESYRRFISYSATPRTLLTLVQLSVASTSLSQLSHSPCPGGTSNVGRIAMRNITPSSLMSVSALLERQVASVKPIASNGKTPRLGKRLIKSTAPTPLMLRITSIQECINSP
jgi:hypothetical protein